MSTTLSPLGAGDRIQVIPAFRRVNTHLLELLNSLRPQDWILPTVHATRDVKDLVAHLVDTTLRRLSLQRDGWSGVKPTGIDSIQALTDYIQTMNRQWMDTAKRLTGLS